MPPPPAPRVVKQNTDSVPTLVNEMSGWFNQMVRQLAAFQALNLAYLTHTGQLPEGERAKGLPVFEFSAPGPDGREPIKCAIDVKEVDQQYVGHVLVPMINVAAGGLLTSLDELMKKAETLRPKLHAMVNGPDKKGGQPVPQAEQTDEG